LTGSGKTFFFKNLLNKSKSLIIPDVQQILYFFSIWQPIYDDIFNDNPNVDFIQGYKNEFELLDSKKVNLLVILPFCRCFRQAIIRRYSFEY
jgi:hypothetical protein